MGPLVGLPTFSAGSMSPQQEDWQIRSSNTATPCYVHLVCLACPSSPQTISNLKVSAARGFSGVRFPFTHPGLYGRRRCRSLIRDLRPALGDVVYKCRNRYTGRVECIVDPRSEQLLHASLSLSFCPLLPPWTIDGGLRRTQGKDQGLEKEPDGDRGSCRCIWHCLQRMGHRRHRLCWPADEPHLWEVPRSPGAPQRRLSR